MSEEIDVAMDSLYPASVQTAVAFPAPLVRSFAPDLLLRADIDHDGRLVSAMLTSFDADGVNLALDTPALDSLIQYGDRLTLFLYRHTQLVSTTLLIVDSRPNGGALSCRFAQPRGTSATTEQSWYRLTSVTSPLFYIEHPWQAGVLVRADLVAVGRLRLLVTTASVDFFPGLSLRCSIHVVGDNTRSFLATLVSMHQTGSTLECHLELVDPPVSLLTTIGKVCLTNGTLGGAVARIRAVREMGYRARELGDIVSIERCTIHTPSYQDVLALRFETYKNVGKVSADNSPQCMADDFDAHAIILIARLGGAPIGTLRLVDGWRAGRSLPLLKYYARSDVAHIDDIGTMEFCRFAIVESFQHTDLLVSLMRAAFEQCMIADFRVGYLLATPHLKRLYARMGARTLADGAPHEHITGETLSLMRFTMSDFRRARGTSLLLWDRVARQPLGALRTLGLYKPTSAEHLIFPIRRLIESAYVQYTRARRKSS